jgi:hypothetical protein
MANHVRAPKQWPLTKQETVTSLENWRQNLLYILSLDHNFAPFLVDGFTWEKKTAAAPNRGLQNDDEAVAQERRKTAAQKVVQLELMLGQIANFCSVISRNTIVKQSTSLNDIWQKIRAHYGHQSTGSRFLDLSDIKLEPDERYEDLFQRLMAFFEDNLLTTTCGLSHHGTPVPADEELSPTIENTVVLLWLKAIHPALPQLVKQRYGPDLRNKTLSSLKPEISLALSSLLDEIHCQEDTKVLRAAAPFPQKTIKRRPYQKSCILCKTANRSHAHNLSECRFLPEADRRFMLGRSRLVEGLEDDDDQEPLDDPEDSPLIDHPAARRVNVIQSPYLQCFYNQHPIRVTLDTGATTNMISHNLTQLIGLPVKPASQMARQADGVTPLDVVGEVHCALTRGNLQFQLDALVVKQLDVDILAGNPFRVINDIATRPAKRQVVIQGSEIVYYGQQHSNKATVRRAQAATLLRAPAKQTVVLPGDYLELDLPPDVDSDTIWALEPRLDAPINITKDPESAWPPPQEIVSVDRQVRITNTSSSPIRIQRHEHLCQIRSIDTLDTGSLPTDVTPVPSPTSRNTSTTTPPCHSAPVCVDPDGCLSCDLQQQFVSLHKQFDRVFNPAIPKYNGFSGKIEAVVNMGPTLPPQRKGRLPHYNRAGLIELQQKFDDLEEQGVFAKPEQVNCTVEYLNLSFLVKKPSGGSRLVTSFGDVARYSKPQPSLMPNVDSVLRDIAHWKYIIATDLKQSFYQIPLSPSSMKYCGVSTPFKGIRVYTRSAMGMPGSETCLEELMSRVLGEFIQEGWVAKIADDLYVGGDTPEVLLQHWTKVLTALQQNNLALNASKTIVCPKSTVVLGWIWSSGTLRASTHRISALVAVDPPRTVQSLRSYIGAYKVLSRVLPGYADLLHPLDLACAGKPSRDKVEWTDILLAAFDKAKANLQNARTITMPQPDDHLWIVTDASVKECGIAATMYVLRKGQLLLAGFFNAKLRQHQVSWLPCEVEALCIGTAIKHFSPFIIQSNHQAQVLTDSKPCVQAYDKLMRGEFSTSARVTTFLSLISRFNVHVRHIAGVANLPSDYASRHPVPCVNPQCQVCHFVNDLQESVVCRNAVTVTDVMEGSVRMPFTNRTSWQATQLECPDLRRTHSHLSQGTRPSKKVSNIPDVRRYLQDVVIAADGLLVVPDRLPFQPSRERIVVPRSVLSGLLTAVHLRFHHPSAHQMKKLITRYFYALDLEKSIHNMCSACHHCASLRNVPAHVHPQSSCPAPDRLGVSFCLDIMKRNKQLVVVLRETVSAFSFTMFVTDEKRDSMRNAILTLCADVRSLGDQNIYIRVDPAPGLSSLASDPILQAHGIQVVIGQAKNVNKNPVAERCIQELGLECLKLCPEGGPLTAVSLALATANMNARIRECGLSSREMWTHRDQITGEQLPLDDQQIIHHQQLSRSMSHGPSAKSKAHGRCPRPLHSIQVGDLVYIVGDRDKTKARDRYLVVERTQDLCKVRKFTQSQYRAKVYDVPVCDCYPVLPTTLDTTAHSPNNNIDSDEELIYDNVHPTTCHLPTIAAPQVGPEAIPDHPVPPLEIVTVEDPASEAPVITQQPDTHDPSVPSDDIPSGDNSSPEGSPTRELVRPRHPPKWMTSGDWEV